MFKSNNLARVRKQNCSSFASFGFKRRLVGLANVLQLSPTLASNVKRSEFVVWQV